jgi:tellurite resistance protein
MLLQHAVILTFADGEQSDAEKKIIDDLVQRLRLEDSEAKELLATSEARARRHLDLL